MKLQEFKDGCKGTGLTTNEINKMHSIIAIVVFYRVSDEYVLSKIIDDIDNGTVSVANKYQMNEVVMILRFLKKQSTHLSQIEFKKITAKEERFWNMIQEVDLSSMNDQEKEEYCVEYINGFGFRNICEWIKKIKTPYYLYAFSVIQYILAKTNHYDNIYEILYIFNTPEKVQHETFISLFEELFVTIRTQYHLDSFIKIIGLCVDTPKYFSKKQVLLINEIYDTCNKIKGIVNSNENETSLFDKSILIEVKERAQQRYDEMKRKQEPEKKRIEEQIRKKSLEETKRKRSHSRHSTETQLKSLYLEDTSERNKIGNYYNRLSSRTFEEEKKKVFSLDDLPGFGTNELRVFDEKKGSKDTTQNKEVSGSLLPESSEDEVFDTKDVKHHQNISILLKRPKEGIRYIQEAIEIGGIQSYSYENKMKELMIEFETPQDLQMFLRTRIIGGTNCKTF
ncbi:hypothetical protein EDI_185170 [Entamoeba dispar SAW760]|uniref:Uncharacterized protein n=1 Tax=Entamoeba dispar (strain ATCC PRA-260 / SAW760) TaxID=370354 RepID=B0ER79_ENTDS|nr:uncharacterized protein EDI_185170 [Entamoeba dispar SAW760]EDR22981.1 hypothetical protein EDI_185170 [Entamoeba dispar SAW760]|eukprot:EDR22981.1 hypothetical protein EDI_185170 [Entamoeba dispar SAW760]